MMAMTDWRKQHEYEIALAKLEQAQAIVANIAEKDMDDPDPIGIANGITEQITNLQNYIVEQFDD